MRILWVFAVLAIACQAEPPAGQSYYDRVIQPILTQSCSRGSSGCHAADPQDQFAFAAGNLDVTTFDRVHQRNDVLINHGAYPVPLLLLKAVGPTDELQVQYRDRQLPSKIQHAGGAIFKVGSPAFLTLQTWLENGATRDGRRPDPVAVAGSGGCAEEVPADFDAASVDAGDFDAVEGVLDRQGCGAQSCHGAPQSDFYLTCGRDARQRAFNFAQLWSFTAQNPDHSEYLRRPVAGGAPHTGGVRWSGTADPDYQTLRAFAVRVGPRGYGSGDPGRTFFADQVMPILIQRGCAALGCHSPAAMNDFRLRAGTQGFFSPVALEKSYLLTKNDFMAFEAPDVRRGRLVAKNLFAAHGGIAHRGGPLLEDPADLATLAEWARLERVAVGNPNAGAKIAIVYVERDPAHQASLLDFGAYQPGSDLLAADLSLADGSVSNRRSLLAACGIDLNAADVHAPDVANDGDTVAFAMRRAAADSLHIYAVKLSGGCPAQLSTGPAHDFDPAWSPDGNWLVFASSRVGALTKRLGLPQSDLWRMRAGGGGLERMTFLSNSEIGPQFMREGRVTMTTEKVDARDASGASSGFYQLAGRRINWDLTDYHPLLGQRAQSPVDPAAADPALPSIGFQQATEIRELLDGDFAVILSNPGARGGAGALAVFSRSIGPFEADRRDPGYLASVTVVDGGGGVYRSPAALLDGRIMASWAAGAADGQSLDWDVVAVDPHTGARQVLIGGPRAQVEAVPAIAYPPRVLYENRRQLVFGGAVDGGDPLHAVVHFPDAPMLATLLGANLRRGRDPQAFRRADRVVFLDSGGGMIGGAPLAADGSARVRLPASTPTYIGLYAGNMQLFLMSEEHQFGPGEHISIGVPQASFDHVCAGCHGSVSGRETDVGVLPDVLTSASHSLSSQAEPTPVGN